MKSFEFYIDTKVTTWYRTPFSIDAETQEEADAKAREFVHSEEREILPWEQQDDTIEVLTPKDNGGYNTEELYRQDNEIVWQNGDVDKHL